MPMPVPVEAGGAINGTDAQLIWELVAKISAPNDVLLRYGLTDAGLRAKLKDRMFRVAYKEAQRMWASDLTASERIKVKARSMVEDGLADVFKILKSEGGLDQSKLEAFEKLVRVGDLLPKKEGGGDSKPFSIVMQFTGSDRKVVIDGHALENIPAG